ncbi:MAG: bifunctional glutamate N-acetyltransferase/amino-acid acetyltransferase ArgJ [Alphaproteobacteria bacterium]|nr:bifunctional glutamate N-acetyltransferase/amino-acid acetyltransferase ArgJ [Alphaproteobacteria bacterium]
MSHPRSPLAPDRIIELPPLAGVRLATGLTGMRYKGRDDLALIELAPGTTIAGVLTRSLSCSPPVEWCKAKLKAGKARAIVVNAGNANAFTGRHGRDVVSTTATATAKLLDCKPGEVFIASTGVIGVPLPVETITRILPDLKRQLAASGWPRASQAIMTTDTFPKVATRRTAIAGAPVTISGMCKGSGMIMPDMATMLAFVFTDAKLPAGVLDSILRPAADRSFNAITVDGDTSTSDTLLLCATGQARHVAVRSAADANLKLFRAALEDLLVDLATQVVRDGEGAQKFVTIDVTGAQSAKAARRIGLSIGNSPLVKTALAAGDANWGRVVMAVGKAGEKADRDKLVIKMGGIVIARDGAQVDGYDEAPVARHLSGREVSIEVDVGVGKGSARVWTCDLTHGYIDINASYRS